MQDILAFLLEHWILSGTFVALLILLVMGEWQALRTGLPSVTPEQAVQLLNQKKAMVLDLRSEAAFAQGSLTHAKNIPLDILVDKLNQLKPYQQKPIIVVGAHARDMIQAGQILQKAHFQEVIQLAGGISAWQAAELPLVKQQRRS